MSKYEELKKMKREEKEKNIYELKRNDLINYLKEYSEEVGAEERQVIKEYIRKSNFSNDLLCTLDLKIYLCDLLEVEETI